MPSLNPRDLHNSPGPDIHSLQCRSEVEESHESTVLGAWGPNAPFLGKTGMLSPGQPGYPEKFLGMVPPLAGQRGSDAEEAVAEFREEALLEGGELRRNGTAGRGELLHELLLLGVEPHRCDHLDADLQIAPALATQMRDAAFLDRDDVGALRARSDLDRDLTVE